MKKIGIQVLAILLMTTFAHCNQNDLSNFFIQENINHASTQIGLQLKEINKQGGVLNPRTINEDGSTRYIIKEDWTSGFFPGTMWYLYELTGNEKWKNYGIKITESLDSVKYLTWHHDVGFMINCSFGNAYRLTGNEEYKQVMIKAAESLSTRFRHVAGITQSWNVDRGWQATRGWKCPVIIDNMMNLELLFKATQLSGDSTFYNIAVSHADKTMQNHFRPDYSSYHVIDYDPETGSVRKKNTAQGYAHESAWARGQAWGLYGYTVCYRETNDPQYLKMAEQIANFILNHPNLPQDLIPYWDFDAPKIPEEPRDVSAAAIIASALYELSLYSNVGNEIKLKADQIMESLSSSEYKAEIGKNNYFLLMHSVGNLPGGGEIDVPLNYADYYFLEALNRKRKLEQK
ncbi:glucuronyl hydrolase [Labilibacter sediminis]|nr:glucuronyl hydrolase [Labilibacter sediminis]